MEPIITTELGITLWEYLGKPIVAKVKDKYSEKMLDTALSILKIKDDDKKVIKTELLKCDESILTNKTKFLEFINENNNIQELLKQEHYTNITIHGDVKGVVNANSGSIINQTIS
jgi:hypothetical protein